MTKKRFNGFPQTKRVSVDMQESSIAPQLHPFAYESSVIYRPHARNVKLLISGSAKLVTQSLCMDYCRREKNVIASRIYLSDCAFEPNTRHVRTVLRHVTIPPFVVNSMCAVG